MRHEIPRGFWSVGSKSCDFVPSAAQENWWNLDPLARKESQIGEGRERIFAGHAHTRARASVSGSKLPRLPRKMLDPTGDLGSATPVLEAVRTTISSGVSAESQKEFERLALRQAARLSSLPSASLIDPNLCEVDIKCRVHVVSLHLLGRMVKHGQPVGLDENAGVLQKRFNVLHERFALLGIRHG